jgi:hypothetical protein
MKQEEVDRLISSLEVGRGGIEAYLKLSAADRATLMTTLEQRADAREIRQIIQQCEADGTMDKIQAFLAAHQAGTGSR